MRGKKQNNFYDEDKALLLSFMEKAVQGDFAPIDVSGFHDAENRRQFLCQGNDRRGKFPDGCH